MQIITGYCFLRKGGKGAIGVWDMEAWNKVGIKTISQDPITSFSTSHDGKWLAMYVLESL